MKPPAVYLMHGFIGAGKSTFARSLSARTAALRLNADEYVAARFTPAQAAADWDTCFASAIAALWQEAAVQTAAGRDVILDFGFWTRESRDDARARIAAMGAQIVHYYIDTPDDIILTRLKKREGDIARRNLAQFDSLKKMFSPPEPDEAAIYIRP
jgi:predicted kinase